ncbi:MAG: thioredoxin [Elusimicrobiota bacterium]|nr:thioredoxin [Elusimicrobiota bacterium]
MSEVILTEGNFKQEVSKGVVVVDFWAEWCGPCRIIAPVIEEISKEFASKIKVCKVNVDEAQKLASEYSVMAIPTLIIFKDGKVVDRLVGVQSKKTIVTKLNELLKE